MDIAKFILVGLLVGTLSGMIGVGGAVFIIPILIYLFGWSQHMAQGTALAMLIPPIGILGAWQYYKEGHVDIKVAALMCVGFFVGSYFGGLFANQVPGETLRRILGVALLLISIRMILGK